MDTGGTELARVAQPESSSADAAAHVVNFLNMVEPPLSEKAPLSEPWSPRTCGATMFA
jgi:hypothetical protein